MCRSCATPNRSSIDTACCMVSQSDDEPITTATRGFEDSGMRKPEMLSDSPAAFNHEGHEEVEDHEGREEELYHGGTEPRRTHGAGSRSDSSACNARRQP